MPVPLFLIPPDWNEPVVQHLDWNTDVLTADDGTEQRIQLRDAPVISLNFSLTQLDHEELGELSALLSGADDLIVDVPMWMDATLPTADVALGAVAIECDTTARGFEDGGRAILYRMVEGSYEIVTIATVRVDGLDLSSGTTAAWGENSDVVVLPLSTARLINPIALDYVGNEQAQLKVDVEYLVSTAGGNGVTGVAATIMLGYLPQLYQDFWTIDAVVLDANGVEIPEAVIVWESSNEAEWSVQTTDIWGHQMLAQRITGSGVVTFTATSGAATVNFDFVY